MPESPDLSSALKGNEPPKPEDPPTLKGYRRELTREVFEDLARLPRRSLPPGRRRPLPPLRPLLRFRPAHRHVPRLLAPEAHHRHLLLLVRLREQMEKCFCALPDHRMRWIMKYRWMGGKSMVRIADLLFMFRTVVFEKYNMVLERLILPEQPMDISRKGRNEVDHPYQTP